MSPQHVRSLVAALVILLSSSLSSARVISYAPYTDRTALPAYQHRMNRYFALVESPSILPTGQASGELVLYDSRELEEPRVVFPQDGTSAAFTLVALRENASEVPTILIQTNSVFGGRNPDRKFIFLLSTDGGSTWKNVALPSAAAMSQMGTLFVDNGGPFTRGRYSPVRVGSDEYPFVLALSNTLYAVRHDAETRSMTTLPVVTSGNILFGRDATGTRFLYRSAPGTVSTIDLNGLANAVGTIDSGTYYEGWIASDGAVYLEGSRSGSRSLFLYQDGKSSQIATSLSGVNDPSAFFAVPTFSYSGAWMIQRGPGRPTVLLRHAPVDGVRTLIREWEDITAPEVEALHAGASRTSLLIQVHRPRPQPDQRLFIDPALAVWQIGEPAPKVYDELFLNETQTKGFVHLDVDKLLDGEPFVFDSGLRMTSTGGPAFSASPAGGSDVIQEWGIVRASLKQRLVLPGMARTAGAFGSYWLSDVIIYNPFNEPQDVSITYVPNGDGPVAASVNQKTLTLDPREIRVVNDALHTLFGLTTGGGAFFLEPAKGVNATSRTYSKSALGTYGFGMNAIDVFASTSPRFPVSFAGAFPGVNYRTNLLITDTSGRGTEAALRATGDSGIIGSIDTFVSAPNRGVQQVNGLADHLRLLPGEDGALLLQPRRGTAVVAAVAIDNRTNDPTYFPPDLPAPVVRTIPAIGHLDGAFGARYRSDLYLYNPSSQARMVSLQAKLWDTPETPVTLNLTLLPNEARIIRDVLYTAFRKTGIARLRYQSSTPDSIGVRVTSRTYTIDENGGTYGFLMPPLNNFQAAAPGDTLEILGAIGDKRFRTNIGLVELTAFANGRTASANIEILNEKGVLLDSFSVTLPVAGGMQLNDVFRARGLGDGPAAALIRITSTSGVIGAYATLNDNDTNDPTYLAANLAASD